MPSSLLVEKKPCEFQCKIRYYSVDGGTCLRESSEIFLHCEAEKQYPTGIWSSWTTQLSSPEFYHVQKFRDCKAKDDNISPVFCKGKWILLEKSKRCLKEAK